MNKNVDLTDKFIKAILEILEKKYDVEIKGYKKIESK